MPTLDLGRVIPLERGTWNSGTSYEFMDTVQYEGSTYVSIFSGTHTAADANRPTTTLGQSTYWRRNARGFEPKGTFNTSTAYERDNLVEWGGTIYRCTANTTAGIAPSNGNYWTSFALGIGEYLGEWNSSDAYAEGAVVIWDVNNGNNINGLFRANQATPANTLPSNTTYWDVMAAGFVWLGEWATGTTYRWRSVVSYHGVLYIAGNITGAPSDENPTLLTNWTRISDGFKFVGALESLGSGDNLYYGDVVTFANGLYQVITATTGNDDPRLSPSKFRTLTKWWDYQGAWSSNDSYYDNQIIIYQNSVYRVNQTTTAGDSPDSAGAKFDTIIEAPDNFTDYNSATKRLQIRRVDSSTNSSTAYASGEPVAIIDGNGDPTGELRIHDGATNGGFSVGTNAVLSNAVLSGAKLASSGTSLYKSNGSTTVISESGGTATLNDVTLGSSVNFGSIANDSISGDKIHGGTISGVTLGSDVLKSGLVLQVQSTTLTNNASSTNTDANGIGSDIGLNVTITPQSSNSKFLVQVDLGIATVVNGNTAAIILSRDGTKVGNGSQQTGHAGTFFRFVDHAGGAGNDTNHGVGGGNHYLDTNSGAKGVSTTFKAGFVVEAGTGYINRAESNATSTNNPYTSYTSSTITVTEIEK